MKILLDLQGAQSGSRRRGIGRYSLALAQAIAKQCGTHEVHIGLNGAFPETIESLRSTLAPLTGDERIHVWSSPRGVTGIEPGNRWRRQSAQILREAYLEQFKPDVIHVFSLFEGFDDDTVSSIGDFSGSESPLSVTLHDLIPLIYSGRYLSDPTFSRWYHSKLDALRRADLFLANSYSSRQEGIEWLGLPEEWSVNVSAAADAKFRPLHLPVEQVSALHARHGLNRPFILCSGAGDPRKNIVTLINAYARLPEELRKQYQLMIVCFSSNEEVAALKLLVARHQFADNDVVFSEYLPDADLVALYNLSTVFVFPSLHEGFGLPALEAMQCGTATIGSNTSSLPEVIGRADALFNPSDENDIAEKLSQVLLNPNFRDELARFGQERARKFNWDQSARTAVQAFEKLHQHRTRSTAHVVAPSAHRPSLAFVSPLPPEQSGIATYSAELLPELTRHYKIDVIVDQAKVSDPWINANCGVKDVEWFKHNGSRYDRILYHFGNSEFHSHMFGLLEQHPGTVVLHDFYLSGVIRRMNKTGYEPGAFINALWESHGYDAIRALEDPSNTVDPIWQYPANRRVLDSADGVIVHSEYSRQLANKFYGLGADWAKIPHLRKLPVAPDRQSARQRLQLTDDDFLVCTFGLIGETKSNHRLLEAWLGSSLSKNHRCRLVFVGENDRGLYGQGIAASVASAETASPIEITGFAPTALYRTYLEAADAAVQLRTLSRGESSGTVHDCMAYGVPVIVNLNGAMSEFPADCMVQLPDDFSTEQLRDALEHLQTNVAHRTQLAERARHHIKQHHNPRIIGEQYKAAIEQFAATGPKNLRKQLVKSLRSVEPPENGKADWLSLAQCIAANHPDTSSTKQLLVDVSALVRVDLKTGIQRVVRSVLSHVLANPPAGYRVEPIYAAQDGTYHLARSFTARFLGLTQNIPDDLPAEAKEGDVFLGLDLALHMLPRCLPQLIDWRNVGVKIHLVLHDILPLRNPEWFPPQSNGVFHQWLESVVQVADGIVCVSKAVADDTLDWLSKGAEYKRLRPLMMGWSHNGADILASVPSEGRLSGFDDALSRFTNNQVVLIVGTLEPRKAHQQTLDAFEVLWRNGSSACLVIVGKAGWMIDDLAERLRRHPEKNRRLFWFDNASDQMLMELYSRVSGVLVASEGEGFGLPLVEAAQHHKPILARDLPVFREIAGEHARYFTAATGQDMAVALEAWLADLQHGKAPTSDGIETLTWEQSATRLLEIVLGNEWYKSWMPSSADELGKT